jgi:Zn-dependent protease
MNEGYRDYDPIHPRGRDWRGLFRRLFGPLIAGAIALAKFSFVLVKFGSIFIAVGAYALIWGWKFGVGVVLLILLHELGHYIEAKREGLNPKLPVFIPFLGAYVQYTRGNPWQTVRVAIAGPIFGGLAALVCYVIGRTQGSDLWLALAYFGFFLNLFNLIPFGIFDGGAVWRSARWLRLGGGGAKATIAYVLYFGTALALVVGMIAAHVPQHRL